MSLQRLDLSVAVQLASVEESLSDVEEYIQQLQENAQKVKSAIHEVVDRQVGSLRMRERQLVRQVEVVTAHQTCRLGTQQAGLMHMKGALTATSDLLVRCSDMDSNTLAKIKVDEMDFMLEVQPVKHVSVKLDEASLTSAISEFGSVQLPDTITHHPSPVIPAKVEEYEDEEHDVLHKSVASAASGPPGAPMRITVQFPLLNHHNWLVGQTSGSSDHCVPSKTQPPRDQPKSSDVAAWLSELSLSGVQDDEVSSSSCCTEGFDMVGMSSTSSEGSSIEVVPLPLVVDKECSGSGIFENLNHREELCCLQRKAVEVQKQVEEKELDIQSVCQANEVCQSFNDCVCQNNCKESALEKLQQTADFRAKTAKKRTFSEAEGVVPILAHMYKILGSENSQWLMEKKQNDIQSACQASEVCQSFNDCECTNKCREPALEKLQPTADLRAKTAKKRTFSEAVFPVLAHMYKVLGSENSQWLLEKKQNDKDLPKPVKRIMYKSPSDAWLKNSPMSPATKTLPGVRLSPHSNTWLLKNLKNQMIKDAQEKEEKDREKCTDEKESNIITSEALSEALKRVHVSTAGEVKSRSSIDSSSLHSGLPFSVLPSLDLSDQSWLLSKHVDTNRQSSKEETVKSPWLVAPSGTSPQLRKIDSMVPGLPESLMSQAHDDVISWLHESR